MMEKYKCKFDNKDTIRCIIRRRLGQCNLTMEECEISDAYKKCPQTTHEEEDIYREQEEYVI